MKTVVLKPLIHKNEPQIGIYFSYNESLKSYVKAFGGVYWSNTHKALKKEKPTSNKQLKKEIKLPPLTEQQNIELEKFKKWMAQKRLSANTIGTYAGVTLLFLRHINLKAIYLKDRTAGNIPHPAPNRF